MLSVIRFLAWRWTFGAIDYAVTMPLLRWTWQGLSEDAFAGSLPEFRPADAETVIDMMQGRYLLASKLVDTQGTSPFSIEVDSEDWLQVLHGFAWLRHFREIRDDGSKRFARTLVLDWIGREGQFDAETWAPGLTAQRVLNWLRHYPLLTEGATPEQAASIARALGTQVQSLRVRARFVTEPHERALVAAALVGAALCDKEGRGEIEKYATRLIQVLDSQIDADGTHLSRSARIQLALLVELATIRAALVRDHADIARELGTRVDAMHGGLDALTLGSGEPAYFHGTGQIAHDLLVSVQAQSPERQRAIGSRLFSGYGRLEAGPATVIADAGLVPDLPFAGEAASSPLAFEFSYGTELIVGNCGPAPAELPDTKPLFRRGIAHTGPTINAESADDLPEKGALSGRLRARAEPIAATLETNEPALTLATAGYEAPFGVVLERRMTLLNEGKTLVGQDKAVASGETVSGVVTLRFHLAPGAEVWHGTSENIARVYLANGTTWTFLWEGAEMREEESVRQSAYFGLHRTQQIVLEAQVEAGHEIAWIFTLEED